VDSEPTRPGEPAVDAEQQDRGPSAEPVTWSTPPGALPSYPSAAGTPPQPAPAGYAQPPGQYPAQYQPAPGGLPGQPGQIPAQQPPPGQSVPPQSQLQPTQPMQDRPSSGPYQVQQPGYPAQQASGGYPVPPPPYQQQQQPYPPASGGYPAQQQQSAPYPTQQAGPYSGQQQSAYPGQQQSAPYPTQAASGPYSTQQAAAYQGQQVQPDQQQPGAYAWPPAPGQYPQSGQHPQSTGYGGAQYPYAAGYPAGGPYPPAQGAYGGVPPQQPRRRGLKITLVAAAALVVAAGATLLVLFLGKGDSPTTMARKAAQAIAPAAGLKLSGTIGGAPADLTVTRAGTVEGTYRQSGHQVSRVTIKGQTYIRAPYNFWRANFFNTFSSRYAAGNWAKAPKRTVIMGFDPFLPHHIAQVLQHVGTQPVVTHGTLHGSKIIKLTEQGATYYITSDSPHRLLRITGFQGKTAYGFDVQALTAASIKPTFDTLTSDVRQFKGAPDPGAIVLPDGKIKFDTNCQASVACTVVSKVTVNDPESKVILLKMTVQFAGSEHGNSFATCSTKVVANEVATVSPSCGVSGSVWTNWFDSHVGHFSTWARPHFEATVNSAADITNLESQLTQEQESG
jgi:hypothetical protein